VASLMSASEKIREGHTGKDFMYFLDAVNLVFFGEGGELEFFIILQKSR